MYYFLGRVIALQPDPDAPFVRGEPGHAMLPPGPGAYTLAEPSLLAAAASAAAGGLAAPAAPPQQGPATPLGANNISPKPAAVGRRGAPAPPAAPGAPAPSLLDAVMELLDHPHPLDTLRETGSYGDDGAISRYHNPENYTRALGTVLRARRRPWRALLEAGAGDGGAGGAAAARPGAPAAAPPGLLARRAGPARA